MLAILSNMEMDERLHKKDDKCHRVIMNTVFIFTYIVGREYHLSVVVKYEIGVASDAAERFGNVGAFNRVGFIIVPIYVLKTEVDVVRIIVGLNIREVAHCAVMR